MTALILRIRRRLTAHRVLAECELMLADGFPVEAVEAHMRTVFGGAR
jgi:hypothetical protein